MKFRLTWRNKRTRKSGFGCWQAYRPGVSDWVDALNKSTDAFTYGLEHAEGEAESLPVMTRPVNRFFVKEYERDGL